MTVDTSGFVPGSPPLSQAAIESVYNFGAFVVAQGYTDTNPYSMALGPENDLFVTDAGANLVARRARASGTYSVFATFPNIGNRNSVPTCILFGGDRFYVGNLTGFPFTQGTASVFEVSLAGAVSTLHTGFTMIADIDVDPRDGKLVVLQYARFGVGGFQQNSGGIFKLIPGGGIDTIATGLNLPTGMGFRADGHLFVTTRTNGQILRVSFPPTSRIRLSPPSIEFGNVLVAWNDTSTLRIQNISPTGLQSNSISNPAPDFALVNVPTLPAAVPPGSSLEIKVVFQTTCNDMIRLARAVVQHSQILAWTAIEQTTFRYGTLVITNKNRLVGRLPGVDGLKTGYTRRAGFNILATGKKDDTRLIVVVLGSPESRTRDEFAADKFREHLQIQPASHGDGLEPTASGG